MKTSELKGKQLDHWVAKAQGWGDKEPMALKIQYYTPSTNGGQCFELQSSNLISAAPVHYGDMHYHPELKEGYWRATIEDSEILQYGPTLNIAICRAFVASVYGEEVEDV